MFNLSIFGIGLHVLVALFFAVHAVRHGRELYWLLILFMFPMLGSLVYLFAVFLPQSRMPQALGRTARAMARSLDPGRELREARLAFDLSPTAQHQIRLAQALLAAGDSAGAIAQFDACLAGPFAKDNEIRFGAAAARLEHGEPQPAITLLQAIRVDDPGFRAEALALLLGRAFAAAGQVAAAEQELRRAYERFGSLECQVGYAIWAHQSGQAELAQQLRTGIDQALRHMPRHARALNQPLLDRLRAETGR